MKSKVANRDTLMMPVLFLIFNRLDTTKKVFDIIRNVKPSQLYIAGDGARADVEGEDEKVKIVREYVINNIDWDCEVKTLFQDKNLGCEIAVSTAIDWFFENVEMGIILEDDCLPDASFFKFCQELLEYYKDDSSVMHISGNNFQFGEQRDDISFCFSKYPHIWGWATWRRAWKYFDLEMSQWPKFREEGALQNFFVDRASSRYWEHILQKVYDQKINTWDYRWAFAIWSQGGSSIVPSVNLVTNIGFGKEGTHTKNILGRHANLPYFELKFPLIHPKEKMVNKRYDRYTQKNYYENIFLLAKFFRRLKIEYLKFKNKGIH